MKQSLKNDIKYVEFVVEKYLRDKPNLRTFKEDMVQEGLLGLYAGRDRYDKDGVDKALWLHYQIKFQVQKYIDRKEVKHFRKPYVHEYSPKEGEEYNVEDHIEHESCTWDLQDGYSIPKLKDENAPLLDRDKLSYILEHITIHKKEREVLREYLRCSDYTTVASNLSVSRQHVSQVIKRIVGRCRQYVYKLD